MTKLDKAIKFAEEKHHGQTRKDGKTPYITHPMAVLSVIKRMTDDEDVQCAAVLHDVVEECEVTPEEIEEMFGSRVASIVKELSSNHTNYEDIRSREALLIKMADNIHNISELPLDDKEMLRKKQIKIKKAFFKEHVG